jgi:hypothetical protein
MKITADEEKLLIAGFAGEMKLISLTDGKLVKAFPNTHDGRISGIVTTADQKFWFTSNSDGRLIQWNYGGNSLLKDHGKVADFISSLCS